MSKAKTKYILTVAATLAVLFTTMGLLGAGCRRAGAEDHGLTNVSTATFGAEVEKAEGVVVVDFWATWCPPCRAIAPTLKELAAEYEGRVKICKVDVDQNPELAERFKIEGIPNLILFKDGEVVDMMLGARRKPDYEAWFQKHL